jgi:hypothetical protein
MDKPGIRKAALWGLLSICERFENLRFVRFKRLTGNP